jgi:GTP-binding protein
MRRIASIISLIFVLSFYHVIAQDNAIVLKIGKENVSLSEFKNTYIKNNDLSKSTEKDLNILSLAQRNKKGIVIVVNKWDLIEKSNNTVKEFEKAILNKIAPANDVPIIFTSVIKKQRIYNVIETAIEVYQNMKRKITTSEVNNTLLEIVKDNPPPMQKDKVIRIKYITQLPTAYPQFVFFCNLPQYVREDYKRFIENKIRAIWNFRGSPVDIYFRKK